MKIFPLSLMNSLKTLLCFILLGIGLSSCATYKDQMGKHYLAKVHEPTLTKESLSHRFYFLSNLAQIKDSSQVNALDVFHKHIQSAPKNSTLVFLGNSLQKAKQAEMIDSYQDTSIIKSVEIVKDFKGQSVYLKAENEWSLGYKAIEEWGDFLQDQTQEKKILLPRDNCGFEQLKINEQTVLLVVDSQWYLQDWDNIENLNEDCAIKTRDDFFDELRSEINKNQNKVVLLAMHHPIFSTGNHGGYFSLRNHIFPFNSSWPLPVIGSLINYTRAMSGIIDQDIQSEKYNELSKRISTLVKMYPNVVVVSGHEKNLEFIQKEQMMQINVGGFSSSSPGRIIGTKDFTSSKMGFAQVDITKEKQVWLSFYSLEDKREELLYRHLISTPEKQEHIEFLSSAMDSVKASVYPKSWTTKSGLYRFLWGDHYRDIYGRDIKVPSGDLTKIKGGLTPLISGGGNQSMSLRMVDSIGNQYVMRGVKKSVARFVQTALFTDQYVMESFIDTWTEKFIYDFYTTSHPYTPFIIGDLSNGIGLYHTNPELYYIPKQEVLGKYNTTFGDELYMIEERPSDGFDFEDSFGNSNNIISTTKMLSNLRKDEKYQVDQIAFLRARIFDLLIGDWDRHADQWRWSEFKQDDKVVYKPIPRDRDQAFAKIDGALLSWIKKLPPLRHMQSYSKSFSNPRWINHTAFPLDQYLLKTMTLDDWLEQAQDIILNLDDAFIDDVFALLPSEIQDQEIENIKDIFKYKRDNILDYLPLYYNELRKYVVLSGTDKKDYFHITRTPSAEVKVMQYREKKTGRELEFQYIYSPEVTKEIWIYGLNNQDEFLVDGSTENNKIKVRLIGGKNKDTFNMQNPNNVVLYDYKEGKSIITSGSGKVNSKFTNNYDVNNFNYKKLPLTTTMLLPNVGYNPEDGVKLGLLLSIEKDKFVHNPFSAKHTLKGFYSFNTNGLELDYKGFFANATNKWLFTLGLGVTSPNFAMNYYGMGNETFYFDRLEGKEYKRVRIQSYSINPGYIYESGQWGDIELDIGYKALKVKDQANRFITSSPLVVNQDVFQMQHYSTMQVSYNYKQYNNLANPTKGFAFNTNLGWTINLGHAAQNFAFLNTNLNFIHYLTKSENLVLASNIIYQNRFNSNFDFYDAATLGGNGNLRGFRPQRFTGKSSFVQTTDLRVNLAEFNAGFIPMEFGVYGGFDYGRVWSVGEKSNMWHNSYGAGIWINTLQQATFQCSFFHSKDGGRFVFGLGFGF